MSLRHLSALAALCLGASLAPAAAPLARIDSFRVTALLAALDHDDFDTRQAADIELRRMGFRVLAYLREEQLRTPSFEVKDRLNRIIRDLDIRERLPDLVALLGHADARRRACAEATLRQAGPDQLPALEAQLARRTGAARLALRRIIADLSR